MMSSPKVLLMALGMFLLTSCELRRAMYDKSRIKPYEGTTFFSDGRTARPSVAGTIPRGKLREDELLYEGKINGRLSDQFPFLIDEKKLALGQEKFNIFCSVCHGMAGMGDGMIVRRGFPRPTSFHDPRLRAAPAGYFFDAISNGWGRMYSYASQIDVEDRWAIVAYIRALQLSQNARWEDTPSDVREELKEANP